jgi:hypothetical protein
MGGARKLHGRNWFNDNVALLPSLLTPFSPDLACAPRRSSHRTKLAHPRTVRTSQNLLDRPTESRSRAMPVSVVEAIARSDEQAFGALPSPAQRRAHARRRSTYCFFVGEVCENHLLAFAKPPGRTHAQVLARAPARDGASRSRIASARVGSRSIRASSPGEAGSPNRTSCIASATTIHRGARLARSNSKEAVSRCCA